MKTPLIWKKLLVEGRKVVLSEDIHQLARRLDKGDRRSLFYLQEHGYITRILRGIYYVRSPDERERDFYKWSIYEMVAEALKIKGVKRWYFGLETALKFNGMTHEYFAVNYVITDSYWASKAISILDSKFQFYKWNAEHFKFGIIKKDKLRYSDKEKTILDLAYRAHRKKRRQSYVYNIIGEYCDSMDNHKLMDYFKHYPIRFQKFSGDKI